MIRIAACLALLIAILPAQAEGRPRAWIDRSHEIFFPPALKEKIGAQSRFPVFWWNFAVTDGVEGHELCAKLKTAGSDYTLHIECGDLLADLGPTLEDWARDGPLREPRPSDAEIRAKLDAALAKASLPTGEPGLLTLFRSDPLDHWQELRAAAERRMALSFPRRGGLFIDPATGRAVIPIQMAFAPSETRLTRELVEKVGAMGWALLGPHGSTLANEAQANRDVESVSRVGALLLVLFAVFLLATRRWRLLLLVPPVLMGVLIAMGVIVLQYGAIHGLTVALGTGIIGLSLDYGLHAALDGDQKRVWRSNLYGLLTTVAGLLVLMHSSIPLLSQMMEFACVGIVAAWLLLFSMFRRFERHLVTKPLPLLFRPRKLTTIVTAVLAASSVAGVFTLHPSFELQQLDFQDAQTRSLSRWLYSSLKVKSPLYSIHPAAGALNAAQSEKDWADRAGVALESVASYLPSEAAQARSLSTWRASDCHSFAAGLSGSERKFFAPFLKGELCGTTTPTALTSPGKEKRGYLAHLAGGSEWISLWLPANEAQEEAVRAKFPEAVSLKEMVMSFPETIRRDLLWMEPLSLLLAGGILAFYYRRPRLIAAALTPFFTGAGLVVLATYALRLDTSFISVVAMILVFGFSIDYGIFATDLGLRVPGWRPDGVWTAITFAAIATVSGFVPLLFCRHPVLAHLGQTLFFGAVGTYIGAVFGIPALVGPGNSSLSKTSDGISVPP